MLKPELAKEMLHSMQTTDWQIRKVKEADRLRPGLRVAALALMDLDPKGKALGGYGNWDEQHKAQSAAVEVLEQSAAAGRAEVFSVLFPTLAPHIEAAWQLLTRLPYQAGYQRKAFRAPGDLLVTRGTRTQWLTGMVHTTGPYDRDLPWFAEWAAYLGWRPDDLGILFAAAIDAGDKEGQAVFDILLASARGEHEIGAMGRHVPRALLAASRPDGWEFIEKLLLAAQRQEGLRQTILETVDEAHPQAFRRMLRLMLDHDLTRFPAAVRAVDVWFGLAWDTASVRVVNGAIARTLEYLEMSGIPAQVLAGNEGSAEDTYLALWALAFRDAPAAIHPAAQLLTHVDVERRFVAAHFLAQLQLPGAYRALLPALDDPDLRIVTRALTIFASYGLQLDGTDLFERLERVVARFPEKKRELEPLVWPWMVMIADRQQAAGALRRHLGDRSPLRLLPYLGAMESWTRGEVVETLAKNKEHASEARNTIFSLVGDPSNYVREKALKALQSFSVTEAESNDLEKLLTRKAGDLRRGVISLLLSQPDAPALASAQQLLASPDRMQRLAGLELLRKMVESSRLVEQCRTYAESYSSAHPSVEGDEEKLLESVLGVARGERVEATLDDGLGLFDPTKLTPATPPLRGAQQKGGLLDRLLGRKQSSAEALFTNAAAGIMRSLDELVHEHREMPVTLDRGGGAAIELLGNLNWGFPTPVQGVPIEQEIERLPLRQELERWWQSRAVALRDSDGLDVLRAMVYFESGYGYKYYAYRAVYGSGAQGQSDPAWLRDALRALYGNFDVGALRYGSIVHALLNWLLKMYPPASGSAPEFLLRAVETTLSMVPQSEWASREDARNPNPWKQQGWRTDGRLMRWVQLATSHRKQYPAQWSGEHLVRLWKALHWLDCPAPDVERMRPEFYVALAAYRAGGATEADILDQLIGPRPLQRWGHSFSELQRLSGRKPVHERVGYPFLGELVERCRKRIIEVEVGRGDMPTAASTPALALRYSGGLDTLVVLLRALGKESFVRGWTYDSMSRAAIFSHLVRSTFPREEDTRERFTAEMKTARITQKRLVELAMYAPQWAAHVEAAVACPQLAEAVWWIHAHTKDAGWSVDQEIRESWVAQVSERTPLSSQGLLDGAVDVAWFGRVYGALGPERWEELYDATKYAAGGGGYKRAQLFADAMLGRVEKAALVKQITARRQQDSLRALGLLPLPTEGAQKREEDILDRYKVIQEFLRTGRKFGSQRQASEKLAASVAMENLARTSGYADPVRLEWAMEAKAVEDLAGGPLTITVDDVILSLSVNDWGEPDLTVSKQGKALKAIPPRVKKDPSVAALREREKEVKRQASRMRSSLENAMCRGDWFTAAELEGLLAHPVLAPMIEKLVFTGDAGTGYPDRGNASGVVLRSHDHSLRPAGKGERLRIAHPHDLLSTGEWHMWQHDLFLSERVQPFKQVFRELYVLTSAERGDDATGDTKSRRYEGHQVNPRQALALLGSRGWVSAPEEGVRRTFHDVGLSAYVTFLEGFYTPADVDGLTIEGVQFTKRGDWKPLPLIEIPPRVFSEVMRDLDLVVSVAHRGGVDPEASASTVEMRSSLVRETCELLEMDNVRLQGAHALIDGQVGNYSVHLGSGVVHRQPGGSICIVPVHSQHRGRLFLPFADDDPKSAEVLSKVLLLAQDTKIQDPTILEQILAVGQH